MWRDLRLAARSLWRSPTFTLTVTLALGLAIGANAAIFSLVDGLWFRPPGVRDAGGLVRVMSVTSESRDGLWSFPEYEDVRDRTAGLGGVAALGRRGVILPAPDGRPELALANVVSLDFFSVLGVEPALGRLFSTADAGVLEGSPGVVLGQEYWRRRFGADRDVVGTTIRLGTRDGVAVRVLGVLPPTFRELEAALDRDIWIPPATWERLSAGDFESRGNRWFEIVARRAPGVSVEAAGGEVLALAAALAREHPDTNRDRSARVLSDRAYRLETGGTNAAALLGLVGLVVLITCVNVANLMLARTAGRRHELSLQVALGASRRRLFRQLMVETTLVGAAGTAAGLLAAMWLIRLLPFLLVEPPGFRSLTLFEVDERVVVFTLGVSLVTTMLFGLAPSFTAARSDVSAVIKGDRAARRRRAGRFGGPLVVAQVAVSLVLLSAAGVLARSFLAAERADLGFDRAPMLTAWSQVNVSDGLLREAVRRLDALPGVRRLAVATRAPLSLSGGGMATAVAVPDAMGAADGRAVEVKTGAVSANYFEAMGLSLTAGRSFAPDEEAGGEPVVIVSEAFVSRFLPGRAPLGQRVLVGEPDGQPHRIVGVAEDAVINEIGEAIEPYIYLPYWRRPAGEITFLLATDGDPALAAPAVRAALADVDASLEPRRLLTMAQYVEYSSSAYRATAALAMALGLVGLVLTALGVYGVIAHRTTRRVKEIGIRLALGAARGEVLRLVLREGVRIGLLGIAIGVPAALVVTRLIQSLLFGIGPWDAYGLGGAVAVLCLAVGAATLIPAWRATRVSPSVALRD
jgi:predicted permease